MQCLIFLLFISCEVYKIEQPVNDKMNYIPEPLDYELFYSIVYIDSNIEVKYYEPLAFVYEPDNIPEKKDYIFDGYYTSNSFEIEQDYPILLMQDMIVYVKWK